MAWFGRARRNQRNRPPRPPRNWRGIARRVVSTAAGAAVIAAAGFGVMRLLDPQTLPLRRLEVAGEFRQISAEQVREVVAPYALPGFFALDVAALKGALTDMPWVHDVSVRREWPDTLHVTVYEQVALARWGDDAVINELGKLFYPEAATIPDGLPRLAGPDDTETEVAAGLRMISRELLPLAVRVRELTLDERRSWRLVLDDEVEVVLGRQDMERRVRRFVEFYPRLHDEHPGARIARIDLRYGNGFAVTRTAADKQSRATS